MQMKKVFAALAVFGFWTVAARAGVFLTWDAMDSSNSGTYTDTQGSTIQYTTDKGPKKKEKALKITYNLKEGGWCGIYNNLPDLDLSAAGTLVFKAKSTEGGDVQMALKDKWNVQYSTKFQVSPKKWAEVKVPLSSFTKDPYYTPPEAELGHPMDLSKLKGLNFGPLTTGPVTLWIGSVGYEEGAVVVMPSAPAEESAAKPDEKIPAKKAEKNEAKPADKGSAKTAVESAAPRMASEKVAIQDFQSPEEPGIGGAFQDSQGSSFAYVLKPVQKKKGEQCLEITYDLKTGGYCGIWHRAGASWDGVDIAGASTISMAVQSKTPVLIGIALKDKTNNQYVAEVQAAGGKDWETLRVPVSSFVLDPYYTPDDAIKGAPMDLSQVKTFNLQPKTEGKGLFLVDNIVAEK